MASDTYSVTGMSCGHCAGAVQGELGRLPGVTDVEVDLTLGQVTVTSADRLDAAAVRAAVEEAGYDLAS
jgi:copper chaperone CopZ